MQRVLTSHRIISFIALTLALALVFSFPATFFAADELPDETQESAVEEQPEPEEDDKTLDETPPEDDEEALTAENSTTEDPDDGAPATVDGNPDGEPQPGQAPPPADPTNDDEDEDEPGEPEPAPEEDPDPERAATDVFFGPLSTAVATEGDLIAALQRGDTDITISGSITLTDPLEIGHSVTISGGTLRATTGIRMINIDGPGITVELDGVTINGRGTAAGISIAEGDLMIRNCVLQNLTTTSNGAAVACGEDGSLHITGSRFYNCSAGAHGGAIYIKTDALDIADSVFSGCIAVGSGGAIYIDTQATGWTVDASSNKFYECSSGGNYNCVGGRAGRGIYAAYEDAGPDPDAKDTYTVTLDVNGGDPVTPTTHEVSKGGTFDASGYITSQPHYEFLGWHVYDNGLYTRWESDMTVDEDITLIARWSPTAYCVIYIWNDGLNTETSQYVQYGNAILPLLVPTRDDHSFLGWSYMDAADGGFYPWAHDRTVDSDMMLFASWEPVESSTDESSSGNQSGGGSGSGNGSSNLRESTEAPAWLVTIDDDAVPLADLPTVTIEDGPVPLSGVPLADNPPTGLPLALRLAMSACISATAILIATAPRKRKRA